MHVDTTAHFSSSNCDDDRAVKQGVALTVRAHGSRPTRPSAMLRTTTDNDRRQRTKQYWPIRRASNKR